MTAPIRYSPCQCRLCGKRPATAEGYSLHCTECVSWHITDEGRAPWGRPEKEEAA